MKIKIRQAEPKDRERIKNIVGRYPNALLQEHLPQTKSFFVAEHKNEIIGCCALDIYSKKIAEVRTLAVLENYRGLGIAKKLIRACEKKAKTRNVRELITITHAVNLFEKCGFGTFHKEKYALMKMLPIR